MNVRMANIRDIREIELLILELENLHGLLIPDMFKTGPDASIVKQIKNILKRNNSIIFVAEIENVIAGMIQVTIKNVKPGVFLKARKYALLENLIVKNEYRNYGIGKTLLNFSENYAKSQNVQCIELNVYEANNNAVEFYKSQGYATKLRRMKKDV